MNWLDSREKKEKEKRDAKEADEKAREERWKQREEFTRQSIPIVQDINILIAKLRWLLPAAFTSTSHLFSNTDAREIISSSLVDDKNISTKTDATNKQELNFDLVEYFYLLRSIFLFIKKGNIEKNRFKNTLMVRFDFGRITKEMDNYYYFNKDIKKTLKDGGFTFGYKDSRFGNSAIELKYKTDEISRSSLSALNQYDVKDMKRTLDNLRNEKVIKFYLWMINKRFRETCNENSQELEEIRKLILKEKKNYNKRIIKLFDTDDIEIVKETIMKNFLIQQDKTLIMDTQVLTTLRPFLLKNTRVPVGGFQRYWDEMSSDIIASLIIIHSLSKINGYNTNTENDTQESQTKDLDKTVARPPKISEDHIYIDGVGWMHEDEVGRDR